MREAVDGLAERGVPTVTLISDIANSRRVAYVEAKLTDAEGAPE